MAIKNHRTLKEALTGGREGGGEFIASEIKSIGDVTRVNLIVNGLAVRTLVAKLEQKNGKIVLEAVCDEILKLIKNAEIKEYYREFLRLYLHQNAIFHSGINLVASQLGGYGYGVINSKAEYNLNIYSVNNDLFFSEEFFIKALFQGAQTKENPQIFEPIPHDYFFHGTTKFKLEVMKQKGVWVPRLVILESTLDCPNPYFRKIVDERSFLEKLIDFLKAIFRIATRTPVPISTFFKPPGNASASVEEAQSQVPTLSSCTN